MDVNRVTLLGRLGRDPEARTTQAGATVVTLSVATGARWQDKATGETRERTEWHRVIIFGDGLTDVARRYLRRGSRVLIEGELRYRQWTDDQGVERTTSEIVVSAPHGTLILLDQKPQEGGSRGNGHQEDHMPPF